MRHRLGVDFGTSNTVAMLGWPDGRVRPLLFDGNPLLASSVFVDDRGALLVGREAQHAARVRPEAFEPNPKRRVDDGTVLLGDRELTTVELFGAVLSRVAAEAARVTPDLERVTLTCPAAWASRRRQVLLDAAAFANLPEPHLVDEPIAAAAFFARDAALPVGAAAVVYDFGAGTFDAGVVRRTPRGFEVLASEGLTDAGGLDVDAAIVSYFGSQYANRLGGVWQRLAEPHTSSDRRANRLLWDDVRAAKETLSRTSTTLVPIPLLDEDAPLGREQLEQLAGDIIRRTVEATSAALRSAGVTPAQVAGVFLVGGSSRIPLAATLLHRALGVAPIAIEQPELVVAEGSLTATAAPPMGAPAARGVATMPQSAPQSAPPSPTSPSSGPPASSPVSPPYSGPPASSPVSPPYSVPPAASAFSAPPAPFSGAPYSGPPYSGPPAPYFGPPAPYTGPPGPPATAPPPFPPPPAAFGSPPPPFAAPPSAFPAQPAPIPAAGPEGPAGPAGPAAQEAQRGNYRLLARIGAGVAVLVVALLILGSSNGHSLFGLGVTSPLAYPAFALVPAAVALLALGARGSLLRRGALLFAGYAVAFTVTMWVAVEPDAEWLGTVLTGLSFALAVAAGVGFAVFGIRRIVRPQAPPKAGRAWLGVALAGVGFAFAELPDTDVGLWVPREVLSRAFLYNSVFAGIGLYLAFLAGVAAAIATGLAAAALVKPPVRSPAGSTAGSTAEPAAKRRAPAVGGTLAGLGGLFVAYVGLVGLIFLADESIVYENNLGALEGMSVYGFFAPAIEWPYLPLIILAVLAGLVVAGLLRSRRSASAMSPDRPTI